MNTIFGKKVTQSEKFLEDGRRIPVTNVMVSGNTVFGIKTKEKHQYFAMQVGIGIKKKAKVKNSPLFLREVRLPDQEVSLPEIGSMLKATEIFKPGDIIDVTGISKGKGYAGVVKRHHFKGGPKTHGQSDRQRAPGAIGSTTTPGRVYRGKRMAGRMGHERVTVKNLQVVQVDDNYILIKGLAPGGRNNLLMLKKVGENKKFVPLFSALDKLSDSVAVREGSDKKIATAETQKINETQKLKKEKKGEKNAS